MSAGVSPLSTDINVFFYGGSGGKEAALIGYAGVLARHACRRQPASRHLSAVAPLGYAGDEDDHVKVFIQAPMESRIERVMAKQGLSREEAVAAIEKVDKGRENYIKKYVEKPPELRSSLKNVSRYDTRNYDLIIFFSFFVNTD